MSHDLAVSATRMTQRPLEALRKSRPCAACHARGYRLSLRGKGGSCLECDGTGLNLTAILSELTEGDSAAA